MDKVSVRCGMLDENAGLSEMICSLLFHPANINAKALRDESLLAWHDVDTDFVQRLARVEKRDLVNALEMMINSTGRNQVQYVHRQFVEGLVANPLGSKPDGSMELSCNSENGVYPPGCPYYQCSACGNYSN